MVFKDKWLIITGGTGSFGNAVLRKFLNTNIEEIRIFSRDEKKQDDMRKRYEHPKLKFYLGDVRDSLSVNAAMRGVDYAFHAAALKKVPSCEFYHMQAVFPIRAMTKALYVTWATVAETTWGAVASMMGRAA